MIRFLAWEDVQDCPKRALKWFVFVSFCVLVPEGMSVLGQEPKFVSEHIISNSCNFQSPGGVPHILNMWWGRRSDMTGWNWYNNQYIIYNSSLALFDFMNIRCHSLILQVYIGCYIAMRYLSKSVLGTFGQAYGLLPIGFWAFVCGVCARARHRRNKPREAAARGTMMC